MTAAIPPAERARILAELVARRAAGESFEAICATPGFPSRPTLRKWLRQTPQLQIPALRRPPVRWSSALAREICRRFEEYSLREISRQPGMPDRKTIDVWRRRHRWFAARLEQVRAWTGQPATGRRSTWCDLIAEDIVEAVLEAGTVTAACRGRDFPHPHTIGDWARARPHFAHALEIAYDLAADRRATPHIRALRTMLEAAEAVARRTAPKPPTGRRKRK